VSRAHRALERGHFTTSFCDHLHQPEQESRHRRLNFASFPPASGLTDREQVPLSRI
jgi:hypothetical protein